MTTPATQLEIAAQWLKEAAAHVIATKGDRCLRENMARVSEECLTVAAKENRK